MNSPVNRVTIHHEGAGSPTDSARGADGGYSCWIGVTRYTMLRTPWISFGTLNFNHVSFDICLSGNRMDYLVTDSDIALIRAACAEARANGWLTDNPDVVFHHDSPGSGTVCPGTHTYERHDEVVAACKKAAAPAPAPNPTPPVPPAPVVKEAPVLIPSPTQQTPNRFDGVKIDFATQTIANRGAGVCAPNPSVIGGKLWDGAYVVDGGVQPDGFRHFVVVTIDTDTYEFHVK